jgi:hypothetical protein
MVPPHRPAAIELFRRKPTMAVGGTFPIRYFSATIRNWGSS